MSALPVYSTRFILEEALTTSASFTCPDGYRAVIVSIDAYMGSQSTAPSVAVNTNGAKWWEGDRNPLDLGWVGWEGRQVLNPGDTFTVEMLNGNCDISVSGYLLTLP